MFGSYGLCQRAGRVGVDPQTNFIEKAGRVEKTVGGFNPQPSPTTKSLLETQKTSKMLSYFSLQSRVDCREPLFHKVANCFVYSEKKICYEQLYK